MSTGNLVTDMFCFFWICFRWMDRRLIYQWRLKNPKLIASRPYGLIASKCSSPIASRQLLASSPCNLLVPVVMTSPDIPGPTMVAQTSVISPFKAGVSETTSITSSIASDLAQTKELDPQLWPTSRDQVVVPKGHQLVTFYPSNGEPTNMAGSEKSTRSEADGKEATPKKPSGLKNSC